MYGEKLLKLLAKRLTDWVGPIGVLGLSVLSLMWDSRQVQVLEQRHHNRHSAHYRYSSVVLYRYRTRVLAHRKHRYSEILARFAPRKCPTFPAAVGMGK